jgi:hypothetical protein
MKTHHTLLAIHLPRKHGDLLVFAHHVVESMTGNAHLPNPTPPLATVTADIEALQAAEVAAQSRAKGSADARDLPLQKVVGDLHSLAGYVQSVADANPAEAVAIITSAGFGTHPHGVHAAPDISAHMGVGGLVMLRAHAVGRHAAYEWQQSADGGKTWTNLPSTTTAHTSVAGLAFAQSFSFRVRGNVGTTTGDWTDPVTILIH